MSLTPIDIHNKEFNRGLRGYNIDEVNGFLNQIIKDYELLLKEKSDLESDVENLNTRVGHYVNLESTLNQSIVIAQETAEELKINARKEAKLIIQEAEKNADRIINDALNESRSVVTEMEDIKKQANVFRARLTMLIQTQLEMVQNEDWEVFEDINKSELQAPAQEVSATKESYTREVPTSDENDKLNPFYYEED